MCDYRVFQRLLLPDCLLATQPVPDLTLPLTPPHLPACLLHLTARLPVPVYLCLGLKRDLFPLRALTAKLWLDSFAMVAQHKRAQLKWRKDLRWSNDISIRVIGLARKQQQRGPEWKQMSHELLLHIYPLIMKELLLNGKNEVSWIRSDKIAGSCQPPLGSFSCSTSSLWHPVRASPKPCLTWCDCPPAEAARTARLCHIHPLAAP